MSFPLWDDLEKMRSWTTDERDTLARALQELITRTYLVRSVDKDKGLYRFVLKHFAAVEAWMALAGWHLKKDETLGVIACGSGPGERTSLNLEETLSLLILRLFYEEKLDEVSLARESVVNLYEFQERYRALSGRMIPRTRLTALLRRFKSLKLVDFRGDVTDSDALLILQPTLPFVLDGEGVEEVHNRIESLKLGSADDDSGDEEPAEEDNDEEA